MLPRLLFRDVEVTGILGPLVVGRRRHQEAVGLAGLPIVVQERLSARALAAEAAEKGWEVEGL